MGLGGTLQTGTGNSAVDSAAMIQSDVMSSPSRLPDNNNLKKQPAAAVAGSGYHGSLPEHTLHNDHLFASSPNSLMLYEQERQDMKLSQNSRLSASYGSTNDFLDVTSPMATMETTDAESWRSETTWSPEHPMFKMDMDKDTVMIHHDGPTLAALNSGVDPPENKPIMKVHSSGSLSDNSLLDDIEDIIGKGHAKDDKQGPLPADPYRKSMVAVPLPVLGGQVILPSQAMMLPIKIEPGLSLSNSAPLAFSFVPTSPHMTSPLSRQMDIKQEPMSPASHFKDLSIATSPVANQSPAQVMSQANPLKRDYSQMLSQSAPTSSSRKILFPSPSRKSPTFELREWRRPDESLEQDAAEVKVDPITTTYTSADALDVVKEDLDDDHSEDDDSDDDLMADGTAFDIDDILEDTSVSNSNKKEKRYFWQYNTQSKGPKGKRLCKTVDTEDPYEVSQFEDPVFDPELNQQKFKHNGKARKGDGNDITPDPYKLYQLGHELRRINGIINGMTPVNELPQASRNKTRKEKNKLASRACRLKKKAQHEAYKVKLNGLETEHRKLTTVLHTIRTLIKRSLEAERVPRDAKVKLDRLIQAHLSSQIAGNTTDFVNTVIRRVAKGDKTGGMNE